ncbi:MAG: DUF721 domain-containing protein [Geminicoccaceae bacterium]|nr:DUF721 domain-containing protein [Geminicoccaceae bacterium]
MDENDQKHVRPSGGPRTHVTTPMSHLVANLLSPAARRRGFAQASILNDWPVIVGRALATRCQPLAIDFRKGTRRQGVLFLRASGGAALELQHHARQLVERVNDYFGFDAIRHIRILQGTLPRPPQQAADAPRAILTAEQETELADNLKGIESEALHRALSGLGRTLKGRGGATA